MELHQLLSPPTAGKSLSISNAGTGTATASTANAGATANQAVTGRMGVTNSAIDINGATTDAVKTVTVTNYAGGGIVAMLSKPSI